MSDVQVFFGTNRKPELDDHGDVVTFGSDPGPIDGYAVRFGRATVRVDVPAKQYGLVPGSLFVAPEVLTGAPGFSPTVGSRTIFNELRDSMQTNQKPTIVFIHGFSNSFQDAIERAGWISAFYGAGGFDAHMFAFTWPSRGGSVAGQPLPYIDYEHDRGTAASSGPAVARTMRILHDFVDSLPLADRCFQELHLLCHSMGNYVLRNGLDAWLSLPTPLSAMRPVATTALTTISTPGTVPIDVRRTFDQIVLAAADETTTRSTRRASWNSCLAWAMRSPSTTRERIGS
jgi:esterase/lipase superfamily enzyme